MSAVKAKLATGFSSIADVIASARTEQKLSQQQVAKSLGIHQATYSRFENGLSVPTITQWEAICNVFRIPYDAGKYKVIDRVTPLIPPLDQPLHQSSVVGAPAPIRYRSSSCLKVRFLLPLLHFIHQTKGPKALNSLFTALNCERLFFVNIDNELNLHFLSDLVDELNLAGRSPRSPTMREISKFISQPLCHASLAKDYESAPSKEKVLIAFAQNQRYYQRIFQFEMTYATDNFRISLSPEGDFEQVLKDLPEPKRRFISDYIFLFLGSIIDFSSQAHERSLRGTVNFSDDPLNPGSFELVRTKSS